VSPSDGDAAAAERHASNLELFLDLVFVFAITQIATLISHHPDAAGTGKGVLVALLVWWQWSQFTWAGSAIDLHRTTFTRVLVLAIIPVTLLMTAAIPEAFANTGVWFGATYLGVQLLVLAIHAVPAMASAATRTGFVRYASFAVCAPLLVLLGSFAHGQARVVVWVLAAVANLIGGLRAGGTEWVIDPVHFAERHALFVIISLGEVLVAAGGTLTGTGLERAPVVAVVAAVTVACTMWWTYFAYIPDVGERLLRQAAPTRRASVARDMYTFGHFPLVIGLVLYAVVVKHLVAHPSGVLAVDDRWLLTLSIACFVGSLMVMQWRAARTVAPERAIAIVVGAGLALGAGAGMAGVLTVTAIAVLYGVMQFVTLRRRRRS